MIVTRQLPGNPVLAKVVVFKLQFLAEKNKIPKLFGLFRPV
jgi:hypothetical protein